jgi:hypothetical protein
MNCLAGAAMEPLPLISYSTTGERAIPVPDYGAVFLHFEAFRRTFASA